MHLWVIKDSWNSTSTSVEPVGELNANKSNKPKLISVFGGAAVSLLLVIVIVVAFFCWKLLRRALSRNCDPEASMKSTSDDLRRVSSIAASDLSTLDANSLPQFRLLDLEHATGNFSKSNIIGEGAFGIVYKGLLADGTIVSIKRRLHHPIRSFSQMVKCKAFVKHKNIVNLVGFCQENHQQFLVYNYLLNHNVGSHLYDDEGVPTGKLNMHQRLLIAIGAAKGLEYLHSFQPPIIHLHFRTRNVLLDENFAAKVSDFGMFGLEDECYSLPSRATDGFLDPKLKSYKDFSTRNDVYSFGVFLLEMISGRKAFAKAESNNEQESLVSGAKNVKNFEDFVEKRLRQYSSAQAMKDLFKLALLCMDSSLTRRPSMESVVHELESIHVTVKGGCPKEEVADVTLGSVLFKE